MIVNVAWPDEFRLPNPIVLLPSRRMTVPVGAPAPVKAGVTVTVSTSGLPTGAGSAEGEVCRTAIHRGEAVAAGRLERGCEHRLAACVQTRGAKSGVAVEEGDG